MSELKLLEALSDISQMCIGEICMNYRLDAQCIGETIYEATGMTSPELIKKVNDMKKEANNAKV